MECRSAPPFVASAILPRALTGAVDAPAAANPRYIALRRYRRWWLRDRLGRDADRYMKHGRTQAIDTARMLNENEGTLIQTDEHAYSRCS